jgi:hypothetical protein
MANNQIQMVVSNVQKFMAVVQCYKRLHEQSYVHF